MQDVKEQSRLSKNQQRTRLGKQRIQPGYKEQKKQIDA
jgi:hypothetical protein